jgi:signal transduction histidine kinase
MTRGTVLHAFLTSQRHEIIARTKRKVVARSAARAPEAELAFGVPLFFDQLIEVLKDCSPTNEEINAAATKHGDEMLRLGFTVGQVVYDYGSVCQAVTELALEHDAAITADEFRTLTRCLDDAIAHAVTEYARLRDAALSTRGTELIGTLAHEMHNRLSAAILSFGVLKNGDVSIQGSTGALLERSLRGLKDIIERSLAENRLESAIHRPERIAVSEFVEEMGVAAVMEANRRGLELKIEPAAFDIAVYADRQLLEAAVSNLLQNAFKFTHEHGAVHFRPRVTAERVLLEIEDQCGGLPAGPAENLFRPFIQRSTDRSGLGLGLSISRRAVQLNGGEIRVRNSPGSGCTFTIDLPRFTMASDLDSAAVGSPRT